MATKTPKNENMLFNVICGDPKTPKETWEIYDRAISLERAKGICDSHNAQYKEAMAMYLPGGMYHPDTNDPSVSRYDREYHVEEYRRIITRHGSIEAYFVYAGWNYRYAMKRIPVEQDFAAREAARTDSPLYLPTELMGCQDYHYTTINSETGLVSFYRSKMDAFDNKRTEMRLGKYIREYNPYKDDNEIGELCAKIGIQYVTDCILKCATTREEISMVYEKGPNSCMSGQKAWHNGVNPCEAYASEDLCVYYIERDGDITARAVCNTKNMRYPRVYGDVTRLEAMLQPLGYRQSDYALGNAKLLKIVSECGAYLMLPYLDGQCTTMLDKGDHMLVKDVERQYVGDTYGRARYYG